MLALNLALALLSMAEPKKLDITTVQSGAFELLAGYVNVPDYKRPAALGLTSWSGGEGDSAFIFLRAKEGILIDNYYSYFYTKGIEPVAKAVTDRGAEAFLNLHGSNAKTHLLCFALPGSYSPDTRYVTVTISAPGHESSILKIENPPRTIDAVGRKPVLVSTTSRDAVTITGEAFRTILQEPAPHSRLGILLRSSGTDPNLNWRWSRVQVQTPIMSKSGLAFQTGYGHRVLASKPPSKGELYYFPFSQDIHFLTVTGALDGFEVLEESINFGNLPLIKRTRKYSTGRSENRWYLDLREPIHTRTATGLKLSLLPHGPEDRQRSSSGFNSLNYRLQADESTLEAGVRKSEVRGIVIVEAKRINASSIFREVLTRPAAHQEPSFIRSETMVNSGDGYYSARFVVRRLIPRQSVPIKFLLPVGELKFAIDPKALEQARTTESSSFTVPD